MQTTLEIEDIFEDCPDGLAIVDREGTVVRANERCASLTGQSSEQLVGSDVSSLTPADWSPSVPIATLVERARDGRVSFTWHVERPEGRTVALECSMRCLADREGYGLISVRKRRQGQDVNGSADEPVSDLIEGMNDAVTVVDLSGNYLTVNRAAMERLGYTRTEFQEMGIGEIHDSEFAARIEACLDRIEADDPHVFESRQVAADGEVVPVEVSSKRITYRGEPAVLNVVRDVSRRKERQRRLKTFKRAIDQAGHAVYITDTDGRIEYVNPAFEEITGYDAEEAVGERPSILGSGELDDEYYDQLWETILDGEVWEERVENERADGTRYHAEQTIAPIVVGDEVVKFVAVQRDITDRRARLRELERYRELIDNVPVGVYRNEVGLGGEFVEVNPAMVELFDAECEAELLGTPVAKLYRSPGQREQFDRMLREEGMVVERELRLETVDGEPFWAAVTAIRHEIDGEVYYDGIVQDVTDRRETERELRISEQRFRRLFEEHNAPMLLIDPNTGAIVRANDAAADFYGYDRPELTDKRIQNINQLPDEDVARRRQQADTKETNRFIFPHELADGEVRQVEVDTTPIHTGEKRVLFSVLHDVTEREQSRERLEHQNEQLEVLNRVVRHDIRNDMTVMLSRIEFLADHVDAEGREHLDALEEHGEHVVELTEIVRDLMEGMLDDDGDTTGTVPLSQALESEVADVAAGYDDAVFSITSTLPDVRVAGNEMLASVFRNLLTNAVQHNDAETPRVWVSAVEDEESVEVRVADNGPGVPDHRKEDIFGKGERGIDSPGTGLGLYLVYTFVDQFGGDVWVTDNEPRGAVFHAELPKAE